MLAVPSRVAAWLPHLTAYDILETREIREALALRVRAARMTQIVWMPETAGIEVAQANSARDFIDALRRSSSHWWTGRHMPWVFRGHGEKSWPLLPSAWRKTNNVIAACRVEATRRFDATSPAQTLCWWLPPNFLTSSVTLGPEDASLQRQLAIEATAELLPIWDFSLACNELGAFHTSG